MKSLCRCVMLVWAMLLPAIADAHKSSDSYLSLNINESAVSGHWDIAIRDLNVPLELDRNNDGEITWSEVRANSVAIAQYAVENVRISQTNTPCAMITGVLSITEHTDGMYVRIPLRSDCTLRPNEPIAVGYTLLKGIDAQHRGLLALNAFGQLSTAVLDPIKPALGLGGVASVQSHARSMQSFISEGVHHISVGIDHVLFICLLVVAALRAHPTDGRQTLVALAQVVTAFTVAHSITLGLAVYGIATFPTRWVETLIAATVLICAIDIFYPILRGPRWVLAFIFGLIHGLGLASALTALNLAPAQRLSALLGFNIGVELGQLAIAVIAVFVLRVLTMRRGESSAVPRLAALPIAAIALVWMVERISDTKWLPI
jgi:HupE / UreJ protein